MNMLLNGLIIRGKVLFNRFLYDEEGDVNVLIGVAVLLAVVFKKQAKKLIDTLFETIGTKAGTTVSEPA